jgi:hypothetical protein
MASAVALRRFRRRLLQPCGEFHSQTELSVRRNREWAIGGPTARCRSHRGDLPSTTLNGVDFHFEKVMSACRFQKKDMAGEATKFASRRAVSSIRGNFHPSNRRNQKLAVPDVVVTPGLGRVSSAVFAIGTLDEISVQAPETCSGR